MSVTAEQQEQKVWSYEDLLALPDDGKRYEIIAGELYEMPSPRFVHGTAVFNLLMLLGPLAKTLGAILRTAPLDVFIPGGNPVQPDIVLLLPEQIELISQRGIEGAPSLAIEILSPSNAERDRFLKRDLYARAGVREYWIVSPEAGSVEVLSLSGTMYQTHVRAGGDELVTSVLLPDVSFPASAVFAL